MKAKKYKAVGDYVILTREEARKRSDGGLILPDSAQNNEPYAFGVIDSVGASHTSEFKAGDSVMYAKHGGFDIKNSRQLLSRTAIMAVEVEVDE